MSAKNVNKAAKEIFIMVAALFVLLLTAVNIEGYLAPKKVLGIETKIDNNEKFWSEYLVKNPNYIPGWIEIGRMDEAREIDPNYQIKP